LSVRTQLLRFFNTHLPWLKEKNSVQNNRQGKRLILASALIIAGILLAYVQQMSPSPLLLILGDYFGIMDNDALLNLSISIIFPALIGASLLGGILEQKIGTRNLYVWTLIFLAAGVLINYFAVSYSVFLLGRLTYGIGFGLGIPFIGSAIMKWYTPKQREFMNTINGLFPFVGTVISFSLLVPVYNMLGNSWQRALGIWGFGFLAVLLLWLLLIRESGTETRHAAAAPAPAEEREKGLYVGLLKRRNIRLLCIAFICDFFCYSYTAVILPTLFSQLGDMPEARAGLWAAIVFPLVGILGGFTGGVMIAKTGLRRPSIMLGQMAKFVGMLITALLSDFSIAFLIIGTACFGFGNSLWMPGLYTMPMELENMNSTRVGAAFALISSCGFVAGFLAPVIGGWLTNLLMTFSGIENEILNHVFGLRWSLFAFCFVNLIALLCAVKLKETGPGAPGGNPGPIDGD
jgi:MFS family permease